MEREAVGSATEPHLPAVRPDVPLPPTDTAGPTPSAVAVPPPPTPPPRTGSPAGYPSAPKVSAPAPNPVPFGRAIFAHPAEEEFARLLDFYRVAWRYEPTSFPLRWDGERVIEAVTPDFYLPEHDLYVELTTMKQSLITRKHRKLRRLRERYPEVDVVLLTRRDYYELLARVGYGAVEITSLPPSEIERILCSPTEIADRVAALGAHISADYAGRSRSISSPSPRHGRGTPAASASSTISTSTSRTVTCC